MVFADPEEVDADALRQYCFIDHIADDLRIAGAVPVRVDGHVAEGVESEFKVFVITGVGCHLRRLSSVCRKHQRKRTVVLFRTVVDQERRYRQSRFTNRAHARTSFAAGSYLADLKSLVGQVATRRVDVGYPPRKSPQGNRLRCLRIGDHLDDEIVGAKEQLRRRDLCSHCSRDGLLQPEVEIQSGAE